MTSPYVDTIDLSGKSVFIAAAQAESTSVSLRTSHARVRAWR